MKQIRCGSITKLLDFIEQARLDLEKLLQEPEMLETAKAIDRAGVTTEQHLAMVSSVSELASSQEPLLKLKGVITSFTQDSTSKSFERYIVLRSALNSLAGLSQAPVTDVVKKLSCELFLSLARPSEVKKLNVGGARFKDFCKVTSLKRFPAGQWDWDMSGLPRSYLLKVSPSRLPQAFYFVASKLKGFAPTFFLHMGLRPKTPWALLELESNKSYYQMARSLELQPAVKGLVVSSWLNSPDTHRISPHLAWLNKVFVENGAFVGIMGAADPNSGVLHRSPERMKLYKSGEFKPTVGLIIWPREAMIKWADVHPEFSAL